MARTAWLVPVANSRLVRKAADAAFVQMAHRRVARLDRMDVGKAQSATLMRLVHTAKDTRFGRDHGFDTIRSVADYQDRVPIREYEAFWDDYWKGAYPKLGGVTWPGFIPYYALSSGTTTGTTKYIPVSREMVRSNNRAA